MRTMISDNIIETLGYGDLLIIYLYDYRGPCFPQFLLQRLTEFVPNLLFLQFSINLKKYIETYLSKVYRKYETMAMNRK